MSVQSKQIKITLFGSRHTGQGPIGRAWGKTIADLPALQPVCIYERVVQFKGKKTIVAAWILSLDPQFEYMRKAMYLESDAFIYTFDLLSQPERSLEYLGPFIGEVQKTLQIMPPQVLVGTKLDPTLAKPDNIDEILKTWMQKHGAMPFFELDALSRGTFLETVEQIFNSALDLIEKKVH
jgi:hypothetical protein